MADVLSATPETANRTGMIRTVSVALLAALPLAAQSGSSGSSSSSTHRVVVVDGEKVVDEKTVNGKSVPSDVGVPPARGDAEAMLREMLRRMRGELPPDARGLLDDLGRGHADRASSSHTRRVVVRNGEVIVDEETRDGMPVRRGPRADGGGRRGDPSTARAEARAETSSSASDSASSSSSGSKGTGTPAPTAPLPRGVGPLPRTPLPPAPVPSGRGGLRPVQPRTPPPAPRTEPTPPRPTERSGPRPVRTVPPRIR